MGDFLAACCIVGENCVVRAGDLYDAYSRYCEDCGVRERDRMKQALFGRRMAARFEKKPRAFVGGHQGPAYFGVGLQENPE